MGAGRIGDIAAALVAGGRAPDTPVAAVRNGTRADQQTVRATLATIADADVRAPSAIVVGDVAALDLAWFERAAAVRALGRGHARRASRRASSGRGSRRSARRWSSCPSIAIEPLAFTLPDARRARLARVHVGQRRRAPSSTVGSRPPGSTPGRSPERGSRRSARAPSGRSPSAASGPTSSPSASSPSRCSTRSPTPERAGARVVLARAEQARDVLPDGLARSAATRSTCCPCTARCRPTPDPETLERVRAGDVDAITFTSSSTVTNFCDLLGTRARPAAARGVDRAGDVDHRRERGLRVDAEADPHTIDGVDRRPGRRARSRLSLAESRRTSAGSPEGRPAPPRTIATMFPERRMRRLRHTPAMRRLVAEARLSVDDLVAPLFVKEGIDHPEPVVSMPGVVQHTQESLRKEVRALADLGRARGDPVRRARGEGRHAAPAADAPDGVVQVALRNLRDEVGDAIVLMADACLDEYTDHGHCGLLTADGRVDNDATLERYASIAVAQADAGADVVAPSGMMDGQVGAIRDALDAAGHHDTAILAYAAKYASALYGPFRDAAECAPQFGDRRGYQMDPAERAGGARRGRARRRRGRRHGDGEAGARRTSTCSRAIRDGVRRPGRGVPRERRVRDGAGGRRAGLDRRRRGRARGARCRSSGRAPTSCSPTSPARVAERSLSGRRT